MFGARIGIVLFLLAGLPLTVFYGIYGGSQFFIAFNIPIEIEWLRIFGYVIGALIGLFSFLFLFIALGASISGLVYVIKNRLY